MFVTDSTENGFPTLYILPNMMISLLSNMSLYLVADTIFAPAKGLNTGVLLVLYGTCTTRIRTTYNIYTSKSSEK